MNFLHTAIPSKHRKKIIELNKELNKLSFFGYFDILTQIYDFLDLENKIKINSVCMLMRNSLKELYSELIKEPKKITALMRLPYNRNSTLFEMPVKIFINDDFPGDSIVTKKYLKIREIKEIPNEYKKFITTSYDLKIVVPNMIIIRPDNLLIELERSKSRISRSVILCSMYRGMRYKVSLSYVNDENHKNSEKKFYVVKLDGENGYVSHTTTIENFENKNIKDIKLQTFDKALYSLVTTW